MSLQLPPIAIDGRESPDWSLAKVDFDMPVRAKGAAQAAGASMHNANTAAEASNANAQIAAQSANHEANVRNNYYQGENANRAQEIANQGQYQQGMLGMYGDRLDQQSQNQIQQHQERIAQLQAQVQMSHDRVGAIMQRNGIIAARQGMSDPNQTSPQLPPGALTGANNSVQAANDKAQYATDAKTVAAHQTFTANAPQVISDINSGLQAINTYQANKLPIAPGMGSLGSFGEIMNKVAASTGLFSNASTADQAAATINRLSDSAGINQLVTNLQKTRMPKELLPKDSDALSNLSVSMNDTPEAAQTKLGLAKQFVQRGSDMGSMQNAWLQQNGNLNGFDQAFGKYVQENPILNQKTGQLNPNQPADGAWKAYMTPAPPQGKQTDSGYYSNGQPVSMEQLNYMASRQNTTQNGVIQQYGLSTSPKGSSPQPPQPQSNPYMPPRQAQQNNSYLPQPQQMDSSQPPMDMGLSPDDLS